MRDEYAGNLQSLCLYSTLYSVLHTRAPSLPMWPAVSQTHSTYYSVSLCTSYVPKLSTSCGWTLQPNVPGTQATRLPGCQHPLPSGHDMTYAAQYLGWYQIPMLLRSLQMRKHDKCKPPHR